MAAIRGRAHGAQTLLLERTKDGGRKILISGGGRCNILPASVDESRFVTEFRPTRCAASCGFSRCASRSNSSSATRGFL